MLGDMIKQLRKAKGLTQEDLADMLHVVRQTVSKWEKNLSVPDADLLQRLAVALDTDVEVLLGLKSESVKNGDGLSDPSNANLLAMQLACLNAQMAIRTKWMRRILTVCGVAFLIFVILFCVVLMFGFTFGYHESTSEETRQVMSFCLRVL